MRKLIPLLLLALALTGCSHKPVAVTNTPPPVQSQKMCVYVNGAPTPVDSYSGPETPFPCNVVG